MAKQATELSINELAKKANVSVRTVRFYIDEGLLPAPQTQGRYSVYGDEYLDRLELIRRLKESFLPLKEIRNTLNSMTWAQVRVSLDDLRKHSKPLYQDREQDSQEILNIREHPSSSALDYIANLISSTPVTRPLPPRGQDPDHVVHESKAVDSGPETWERLVLVDGVEIHIRKPVLPEDRRKINEIIELIHKKFAKKSQE